MEETFEISEEDKIVDIPVEVRNVFQNPIIQSIIDPSTQFDIEKLSFTILNVITSLGIFITFRCRSSNMEHMS